MVLMCVVISAKSSHTAFDYHHNSKQHHTPDALINYYISKMLCRWMLFFSEMWFQIGVDLFYNIREMRCLIVSVKCVVNIFCILVNCGVACYCETSQMLDGFVL